VHCMYGQIYGVFYDAGAQSMKTKCRLVLDTSDEIVDQPNGLRRSLSMYPMSSIQYFQPHIREETLSNRDIVFIQIPRMFTFHEHRWSIPRNGRRSIGEVSNLGYSVMKELEWDSECQVT